MTAKKITIGAAPDVAGAQQAQQVDKFIAAAPKEVNPNPNRPKKPRKEETQRLTLEIPASLHKFIKHKCVDAETLIRDEVLVLLMTHYSSEGYNPPPEYDPF